MLFECHGCQVIQDSVSRLSLHEEPRLSIDCQVRHFDHIALR